MLNTPAPIPLDFLINGQFLRTPLDEYLRSNGLSLESTVTLQYVRSLLPPVYEASFEHDDWVSSVDVLSAGSPAARAAAGDDAYASGRDRVLSASYDGLIRVWDGAGQVVAVSPPAGQGGHGRRLNAARFVTPSRVASAGLDQKVVVWEYTDGADAHAGQLRPTLELYGHRKMINSLDVHGATRRLLTASSDGHIGLWSSSRRSAPAADLDNLPATYSNKRAKLSSSASVSAAQRGPLAMIPVHEGSIATAAVFHPTDATVAYSVSQDHTFRTIDLTTSKIVSTLTTLHPLLCTSAIPGTSLVAAGSSARHITMLDPRAAATSTSVMTLRGHTNMVASLSPSPDNDYSLLSGSHDGTCRVWDLRSVRPGTKEEGGGSVSEPVYMIGREWLKGKMPRAGDGAKVLSCVWDKTWGIVSGGEDKKIQINRGRDIIS